MIIHKKKLSAKMISYNKRDLSHYIEIKTIVEKAATRRMELKEKKNASTALKIGKLKTHY